jgi:hypothetical protein
MKHIHHIVPKHMGGTDDPSNLIELSVEEHAEAHKKLYEEYGNQYDRIAYEALSGMIKKEEVIQQVLSEAGKRGGAPKGRIPWNKGKKGVRKNPYLTELNKSRKGQPIRQEVKEKIGTANTGRKRPDLSERNKKRKSMDILRDESGKFIKKTNEQIIF